MATNFPGRPRLQKGALVAYDSPTVGEAARVIPFQFNPNELSRTVQRRDGQGGRGTGGTGSGTAEARRRVQGPPSESISLTLFLDATDLFDRPEVNADAAQYGLQPALSALELLLYPEGDPSNRSGREITGPGKVRISYAEKKVPLLLFAWGSRVLPVRLTSLSVTEQAFDDRLNPVRAEVSVDLEVLPPEHLEEGLGRDAYRATHAQRRKWADLNVLTSGAREIGSLPG